MKPSTIATAVLTLIVIALAVATIARPLPRATTTTVTQPASAGSYGGSSFGGASKQATNKYPGCTFDGNYANDKPGACPTSK